MELKNLLATLASLTLLATAPNLALAQPEHQQQHRRQQQAHRDAVRTVVAVAAFKQVDHVQHVRAPSSDTAAR